MEQLIHVGQSKGGKLTSHILLTQSTSEEDAGMNNSS
jgi:hypothetical protein